MPTPVDEEAWLAIWNSQSAKPIIAIADPEIEIHAVTLGIEGRLYTGHEGLREWMRDIRDRYSARSHAEEIEALGEDALMVRGTIFVADGFGGEQEQRFAMVVHLRAGKARWIGTFFSAADARQAFESGVTGPRPG
jgi:murein endopeptidase